jgi:hypothetical protein
MLSAEGLLGGKNARPVKFTISSRRRGLPVQAVKLQRRCPFFVGVALPWRVLIARPERFTSHHHHHRLEVVDVTRSREGERAVEREREREREREN